MASRRSISLILGDALEQMRRLPSASVDLVLTSPPYNLGEDKRHKGGVWPQPRLAAGYRSSTDNLPHATYVRWQHAVLSECWRLLTPTGAIFYVHKPRVMGGALATPLELNPGLPLRQIVIWARNGGVNCNSGHYAPHHEWVCVFAKPGFLLRDQAASAVGDVWNIAPERGSPHPAPFPLELAKRALETTRARVVLDPFMGSGTTGVAAVELARDFIGIEKDETYMDIAKTRIASAARRRTIQVKTLTATTPKAAQAAHHGARAAAEAVDVKVISFRCPKAVHEALRTLAFAERSSIQRILEDAVVAHLDRHHVPSLPASAARDDPEQAVGAAVE